MRHGVVIQKKTIDHPTDSCFTSRRLQISVVEVCNLSDAIFVFETQVTDVMTLDKKGVFKGIATPVDLQELPVGTPLVGGELFRKNIVDLIVRSPEMETAVWTAIHDDIETLITSLDELVELLQPEEVTVP